jgi:hypothetical protein
MADDASLCAVLKFGPSAGEAVVLPRKNATGLTSERLDKPGAPSLQPPSSAAAPIKMQLVNPALFTFYLTLFISLCEGILLPSQ